MAKVITGFHSIEEKVRAIIKSQNSNGVTISYSKPGPRVKKILAAAKEANIKVQEVDNKTLDSMVADLDEALQDHRGIVMTLSGESKQTANIVNFDDWIKTAPQKASVLVLDKVTDPHNVGAIIRSCDQFGASLVVLPEHNSANDIEGNEVIGRTSAGASAWVPVAIVNNLVRAVEELKDAGFWIYGADAGGQTLGTIDFPEKTCIIMGSEGSGISQLLEKKCDSIVSIPTCGKIDSLNVSVAAGVLLYELYRRQN
ncbi:MAG: 23S rRNA (guanosine(2251)-2'-O)-methyltransferase RlmB [Treponema sp.]|nr:23S rRNA (guanosine(2251)-2'-O)-methyltransferase RlmB [Treponema sp.]